MPAPLLRALSKLRQHKHTETTQAPPSCFLTWATGCCGSPLHRSSSSTPTPFQGIPLPNTSQLTHGKTFWQAQAVGPRNSPTSGTVGPLTEGAAARPRPPLPLLPPPSGEDWQTQPQPILPTSREPVCWFSTQLVTSRNAQANSAQLRLQLGKGCACCTSRQTPAARACPSHSESCARFFLRSLNLYNKTRHKFLLCGYFCSWISSLLRMTALYL